MGKNNPKIGKSILKDLFTKLTKGITGKEPKNIDIEEGMSVNEEGNLEENASVSIDMGDGSTIEGEVFILNTPEDFARVLNRIGRERAEEHDRMDAEYKKWIVEHYARMGLIDDFREQFPNVKEFEGIVLSWVEDVNADDFIWLCDELKEFEEILNDENITNHRICRSKIGEISNLYKKCQMGGCCKIFDHAVTNPKTGNRFYIGCNHDHEQNIEGFL